MAMKKRGDSEGKGKLKMERVERVVEEDEKRRKRIVFLF